MYSYKAKEAVLYVVKQVLDEISDKDAKIGPDLANAYLDFARLAIQDGELILRCSSEDVQLSYELPMSPLVLTRR
jgi:transcription termination factor NusB